MVLVLYGSVTGNAQELAETLFYQLRRRSLPQLELLPFGKAKLADLPTHSHIFVVCSTTGDGELPANTQPLWTQLLRKNLDPLLANTKVYSFGLGSTAYPKFNYAMRKILARLRQLGAVPGLPLLQMDENDADSYGNFDRWVELALENLDSDLNCAPKPAEELLEPWYSLEIETRDATACKIERAALLTGVIQENRRLTDPEHFQDVRHVAIEPFEPIDTSPGDVISLYPANDPRSVNALLESQRWSAIADTVHITPSPSLEPEGGWVRPLTLRNLVTWHLDLNSVPSPVFFSTARHFCTNSDHQDRMLELASDTDDRYAYAVWVKRSVIEVILEFDSLRIPLQYLLDLIRLISPRQYSLSSPHNSAQLEVTAAVVRYNTFLRRLRRGLCTNWLASLDTGTDVFFSIQKSRYSLLENTKHRRCIFVATGTGIAPVRSLLLSQQFEHRPVLIYGTRHHDMDYMYAVELQSRADVLTAFSRQGGGYVQDIIRAHRELDVENAFLYVCGSSGKMPQAVQQAFEDVLVGAGRSEENARTIIRAKQAAGLYVQDTW